MRALYDLRNKPLSDRNSEMTVAREQGLAEGMEKGARQKAIEAAHNMLLDGLPIETIARYSGLSVEEIKKLS